MLSFPKGTRAKVSLNSLTYDQDYQNNLSQSVRARIEKAFNPALIGTIYVSVRGNGRMMIVDGLARVTVLREDKGFKEWEVLVFRGLSVQQEAEMYTTLNTFRKKDKILDMFKARLTAEDDSAVRILDVVRSCGFKLEKQCVPPSMWDTIKWSSKPVATIKCVRRLESVFSRKEGAAILTRTLTALRDGVRCMDRDQRNLAADAYVIDGLAALISRHPDEIDMGNLREKISKNGLRVISIKAKDARLLGKSGRRGSLRAWYNVYNKGLRNGDKLPEPDWSYFDQCEEDNPT